MPKGKLNVKDAEMENFVNAAELADIKLDNEASRKVGKITVVQFSYKSAQSIVDLVNFQHEME